MELTPSEKDLLLCAARSAAGRVDLRLTKAVLSCRLDVNRVIQAAQYHGMLPLLGRHLQQIDPPSISSQVEEYLGGLMTSHRERMLRLCAELVGILHTLEQAGIQAVSYKGPAMAADLYGEPSLRDPSDLDLLIHWRDLPRAAEVMGQAGFVSQPRLSAVVLRTLLHSECDVLLSRERPLLHVELHWNVLPPPFGVALDVDGLFRRARSVTLGARTVRVPSYEDLLLCLCVNGAKDSWRRLETVTAVTVLCGRPLDWDALAARARAWHAERMLLLGVSLARELLESELPEYLLGALQREPQMRRLTRRVCNRMFDVRGQGACADTRFRLQLLEGSLARWRYLAHRALVPTCADVEWFRHPSLPLWLYAILRPLRLTVQAVGGRTSSRDADLRSR